MKILFYDWALHTIGGGQKFNCKIIEYLSKLFEVDVLTLFPVDKKLLERYYSVDLSNVKFTSAYSKKSKIPEVFLRWAITKKVSNMSANYDIFFNGDGQEKIKPKAKRNILYCHFFETAWYRPSKNIIDFFKISLIYILKLTKKNYVKYYDVYCNSLYTRGWIKKLWNINSEVIYPPIDLPLKNKIKKQNIIISTGRISPDKNYELVIEIFKKAYSKEDLFKKYKLIICGKSDNLDYLLKLKALLDSYPIEFKTDLSNEKLKDIYSKSKIFIQAKGYSIDEEKYPGLLEHFGMTTAEAMSYGCVPVVLNKGGYKEIVVKGSGFKFDSIDEAVRDIIDLVKDKKKISKFSKLAIRSSKKFSLERMQREIDEALKEPITKKI